MPVPPRPGLVCLAPEDFATQRAFYVALGWPLAVDVAVADAEGRFTIPD